jgi:outer membrane protein OmpA-like peptidoglycan-associated protein
MSRIVSCLLLATVGLLSHVVVLAQQPRRVEGISTDKYTEFAPTISADGNTMIIQSNRNSRGNKEHWELFESIRNADGSWPEPVPLKAINDKCLSLGGPSLSYDGNRIYFTAIIKNTAANEDIFYSDRLSATQWSEPHAVGHPVNSEGYEGFPSISADGKSLYFMRVNYIEPVDAKTNEDCFEIYVSHKLTDGAWSEPQRLPDQINVGCVRDPRIMADNHTLIFSAITPDGKGNYDLFQSRKNPDGTWTKAKALDFINSGENDQAPTIPAAGDVIFFYTKKDIYAMPVPLEFRQSINVTIQGFVKSEKHGSPMSATMRIKNLETGEITITSNNPNDGRFSLVLAAGGNFRVEFFNPASVKVVKDFDLRKQDTYEEIDVNIMMKSHYLAKLNTVDADLKTNVASFVELLNHENKLIWQDSIRPGQQLPTVPLEVGAKYFLSAVRRDYDVTRLSIIYDANQFKEDTTFTLLMTHEKVKFSTEVVDVTSNKRIRTKVTFNNTTSDEVLIAESGESVYLRKGDRYQVVASSDKGYFFSTTNVLAGEGQPDQDGTFRVSTAVTPLKEGASLTLRNITFETNSAELTLSSFAELDRVIELMNRNPGITIQIAAHTDDVGNDKYNINLSLRRAQSVVGYLNRKGIGHERFATKGYGKTRPLAPNTSEASRAMNRRVELTILKAG